MKVKFTQEINLLLLLPLGPQPPKGFLRRRGEAASSGCSVPDQNPTLHAGPGPVPAALGPHRPHQRAGRLLAGAAPALKAFSSSCWTVGCSVTQSVLHSLCKT